VEKTGLGTIFARESAVPGSYDDVAQVAGIAPPGAQREAIEVDELDPLNGVKKKIIGIIDVGEFTVTLNFDPDLQTHKDLESDLHDGLTRNYKIIFPYDSATHTAGGYYTISAVVTSFAPSELSASEVKQAEVTLTVKAKPEYTDPVARL